MRKPTMTVRIDIESHSQLARLADRFKSVIGGHVSIADAVRMGIALLAKEAEKRNIK